MIERGKEWIKIMTKIVEAGLNFAANFPLAVTYKEY